MLIEDPKILHSLAKIVGRITADRALQEDLMQECLVHLWTLEREGLYRTDSWYLQNCRFHLQHYLALGRSLDSLKRTFGDRSVIINGDSDELPLEGYLINGEFYETINAHDIVSTLSCHLQPREKAVLAGLSEGSLLREIAARLRLSYPTALKLRRKIAALAIKLGVSPPPSGRKGCTDRAWKNGRVNHRQAGVHQNGVNRNIGSEIFVAQTKPRESSRNGRRVNGIGH